MSDDLSPPNFDKRIEGRQKGLSGAIIFLVQFAVADANAPARIERSRRFSHDDFALQFCVSYTFIHKETKDWRN
ncbi:MAG: hypothetical protein WCD76_18030 [Pyrinomonadaceae bacterium]